MDPKYLKQFRFCFFCGTEYQATDFIPAEVALSCGNCSKTNYLSMKVGAAMIIPDAADHSKILLLKRLQNPGRGLFNLPGGFILYGEDPDAGAKREIKEELGIDIKALHLFSTAVQDYEHAGSIWKVVNLFYLSESLDSMPGINSESSEYKYVLVTEVVDGKIEMAFNTEVEVLKKYAATLYLSNNRRRRGGNNGRDLGTEKPS